MPASIIKPKKSVFKPQQIERVVQNTLTALAKDMKVDFDVTTQTWSNRPKTKIESPSPYERTIAPDSELYAMLDKGTKKHDITPKNKPFLIFKYPFRPKTVPNQIRSNKGGVGNQWAKKIIVHHPGTKPRNWAKVIAAKWRRQAPIIMQRAISAEYSR